MYLYSAVISRMPLPSFTGNVAEWEGANVISPRQGKWTSKHPESADDSSVTAKVAWCDDGLLLGISVADNVFFQPFTHHGDPREADAIEVGVTKDRSSRALTMTVADFGDRAFTKSTCNIPGSEGAEPKVAVTPTGERGGRFYELLIPWSRIPGVRESGLAKIAVKVYDNDGDGKGLRGVWRFHEGLDGEVSGYRFGLYTVN